ncbi:MAG: NADH-quinone oxidoreductase subunit A [Actinobacteria bacterium]|nr:NADH-quinone oxidoreductase subunit A [Actinomycetota bacterium]
MQPAWPLLVFVGLILALVALIMSLSYLLGQRQSHRADLGPYESGVAAAELPAGISVEFYRLAVFFVIFDVEAVFLFIWAVVVREVGWSGYAEMLVFVGVLFAALVYLWRLGSLDWRQTPRKRRQG